MMNFMQTYTGKTLYFLEPRAEAIDIEDIAHGLSNVCRFNGQCKDFYSVAEHSLLVASKVHEGFTRTALLHDASEAYVQDLVSPLKALLPNYKVIEDGMQAVIVEKFSLLEGKILEIKKVDLRMLVTEKNALFNNHLLWNPLVDAVEPYDDVEFNCYSPKEAEEKFLEMFYSLWPVK